MQTSLQSREGLPSYEITKVRRQGATSRPHADVLLVYCSPNWVDVTEKSHGTQVIERQRSNGFLRCSPACTLPQVLRQIQTTAAVATPRWRRPYSQPRAYHPRPARG